MNVRLATEQDIPTLLAWGKAFFDESVYAEFGGWSDAAVEQQIAGMLNDLDSVIIMIDGVGMIGGTISIPYYSETISTATELWWYVVPEHRKSKAGTELVRQFGLWAREAGATHLGLSSNKRTHPKVHDFLLNIGLTDAETTYIGAL